MSLESERDRVNRSLAHNGLPTLDDDPAVILAMMAQECKTHERFRELLSRVEIHMRGVAYETMRPYLEFHPKPLDVYMSELARKAEQQRLPVKDDSAPGGFREFQPARNAKLETAQNAVATHGLLMTCSKCTREQVFHGDTVVVATIAAREAGWVRDLKRGVETCPRCPAVRE